MCPLPQTYIYTFSIYFPFCGDCVMFDGNLVGCRSHIFDCWKYAYESWFSNFCRPAVIWKCHLQRSQFAWICRSKNKFVHQSIWQPHWGAYGSRNVGLCSTMPGCWLQIWWVFSCRCHATGLGLYLDLCTCHIHGCMYVARFVSRKS